MSKIIRAMETGYISDKYDNPECCINIKDNSDVTQLNFTSHDKVIRVFNNDFIKQNLRFIINPNENIQPFAILGGDNNKIDGEITVLREKLGSNTTGEETAFYKDLKTLDTLLKTDRTAHTGAVSSFDSQLRSKATNNPNGIKYKSDKYGDKNYTITKLKSEIENIIKDDFTIIFDEEKKHTEDILLE